MARKRFVVTVSRITKVLNDLRNYLEIDNAYRHAQLQDLALCSLIFNREYASTYGLDTVIKFVSTRGIEGVDGILFTCMTAAQFMDLQRFNSAVEVLDILRGIGRPDKTNLSCIIAVADLGKIATLDSNTLAPTRPSSTNSINVVGSGSILQTTTTMISLLPDGARVDLTGADLLAGLGPGSSAWKA
jgi:hypothetical protein